MPNLLCDDCRKAIKTPTDELCYFDSHRCQTCHDTLAEALAEANAELSEEAKLEYLIA